MHKKTPSPQIKNSPIELGKDFKSINTSLDDMDKFEERNKAEKKVSRKYLL